jgi:hypothetical protein
MRIADRGARWPGDVQVAALVGAVTGAEGPVARVTVWQPLGVVGRNKRIPFRAGPRDGGW